MYVDKGEHTYISNFKELGDNSPIYCAEINNPEEI